MDRKEFLTTSIRAGLCGCGALATWAAGLAAVTEVEPGAPAGSVAAGQRLSDDLAGRMRRGSESPDWMKYDKARSWIKSMIDNLDEMVDDETKIKLMHACGRACYNRAVGVADARKPTPEEAEVFLGRLEQAGYKIERGPEHMTIFVGWYGKQNPWGLSLKEGYCLCNAMEENVPGLSPTFCNCSAGYVKEIIERGTGRRAKSAEVLESLKMGGKDCRFKVVLPNA